MISTRPEHSAYPQRERPSDRSSDRTRSSRTRRQRARPEGRRRCRDSRARPRPAVDRASDDGPDLRRLRPWLFESGVESPFTWAFEGAGGLERLTDGASWTVDDPASFSARLVRVQLDHVALEVLAATPHRYTRARTPAADPSVALFSFVLVAEESLLLTTPFIAAAVPADPRIPVRPGSRPSLVKPCAGRGHRLARCRRTIQEPRPRSPTTRRRRRRIRYRAVQDRRRTGSRATSRPAAGPHHERSRCSSRNGLGAATGGRPARQRPAARPDRPPHRRPSHRRAAGRRARREPVRLTRRRPIRIPRTPRVQDLLGRRCAGTHVRPSCCGLTRVPSRAVAAPRGATRTSRSEEPRCHHCRSADARRTGATNRSRSAICWTSSTAPRSGRAREVTTARRSSAPRATTRPEPAPVGRSARRRLPSGRGASRAGRDDVLAATRRRAPAGSASSRPAGAFGVRRGLAPRAREAENPRSPGGFSGGSDRRRSGDLSIFSPL
ncbi:hypothetical protein CLV52_0549 [Amnibacterium kyonggiense]|uniref:Uncharacterized protein n=1 Tax=Amnibacterium kyonggiense TaxID=595671 RepID=A0A4R7FQE8_9MICO|nr:hypothetical protein CLV52_0549 [Amnibacterium kyonggiense]